MAGVAACVLLLRLAGLAHAWMDTGSEPGRIGSILFGILFNAGLIAHAWMLHRRVRAKASAIAKPFWLRTFDVV